MTIEVDENGERITGQRYMAAVRGLPCAACRIQNPSKWTRCSGPIEAHHAGPRPGVGLKADDTTTIPLCSQHHRDWHGATGPFYGWVKAKRREWSDAQIEHTQTRIWGAKA